MTNRDILNAAMRQSAVDLSCVPEDFMTDTNKIVISKKNQGAHKYLELPFECDLVSYGNNIVASVCEDIAGVVENYWDVLIELNFVWKFRKGLWI